MSGGHGIMTVKQTHEGIKSPPGRKVLKLSLIHITEPTTLDVIS